MTLVDLVRRHGGQPLMPVVGAAIVGGLLGAVIVAVANLAVAGSTTGGSLTLGLAFLAWASDPSLNSRKQIGWQVLIYLLITSILLYIAKRRVWASAKH